MTTRRKDPIRSKFKPDLTRRKDPIKSKFKPPEKPLKKLPSGKGIVRMSKLGLAMSKLGLTTAQQLRLKKEMEKAGGITSSDALKATAAMIKSQKTQSKGPAGKVMKKSKSAGSPSLGKILKRARRRFAASGRQSTGPVGKVMKKQKLKF